MPDRQVLRAVALISMLFPVIANATPVRELSSNERVEAQRAIERVYYSHLTETKKTFEQAVTQQLIERKVKTYLKQSAALEQFWNTPVTAEMLRAEADRIERNTKFPERLGEIRAALGYDSFLIQETLVRATLVDRLARGFLDHDERIQGGARAEAEQLHAGLLDGTIDAAVDHPRRTVHTVEPATAGTASSRLVPVEPISEDGETSPVSAQSQPGEIGPMAEDSRAYTVDVTLPIEAGVSRVAAYSVPKVSWDTWWADLGADFDETLVSTVADAVSLLSQDHPPVSANSCLPDNTWDNGALDDVPDGRYQHVSVWTGAEMIVWGGRTAVSLSVNAGRYDPLTDTWRGVSLDGAPPMAFDGTAVWTGTEMIMWGGLTSPARAAGRYDPVSDTWSPVSTVGEPDPRWGHSAIWTGEEMIVWGGLENWTVTSTGARYDPVTDTWRAVSQADSPVARLHHSAVWTGSEMIVWGGEQDNSQRLFINSGARFDPATDTWTPISPLNAPRARAQHTALWINGQMIIWGGLIFDSFPLVTSSGGRYDPLTDTWTSTSISGAPSPRRAHTAIWTGTRMIVWGGSPSAINFWAPVTGSGALYDPSTNTWLPTSQVNAPGTASFRTAVWTGSLMIVWGGANGGGGSFLPVLASTGGRYNPASDSWTNISRTQGGLPVYGAETTVWTGTEMLAWSAGGGRYDPMTDSWRAMSTAGAPLPRVDHVAVWTGEEMVVWGGYDYINYFSSGGRYNPVSDSWRSTSLTGTPQARRYPTAVWTGEEMIVWGGLGSGFFAGSTIILGTGGRYNPSTDTWQTLPSSSALIPVYLHTAVWTGQEMIVWGGFAGNAIGPTDRGARYEPATDMWFPLPTLPAGQAREGHTATWTGSEMIVLGGGGFVFPPSQFRAGWIYNRASNTWAPLDLPYPGFPLERHFKSAVWTGRQILMWGGGFQSNPSSPGVIYDRVTEAWSFMSRLREPLKRAGHSALWTGSSMLVWGGGLQTGGRYIFTGGVCNSAPTASAGADLSAECTNSAGATVTLAGSGSSDSDSSPNTNDDIVLFEWIESYGTSSQALLGSTESLDVTLPLGEHAITLRVTDSAGESDTDDILVQVVDLTAPEMSAATSPALLWPPNHHMVEVAVAATAVDLCGPSWLSLVSVSSNEPDDAPGGGDGTTSDDIQVVQAGTESASYLLRAERDASGNGRIYSIVYQAVDASGNISQLTVPVVVPHDQGGVTQPLDLDVHEQAAGTVVEWNHVPGALFYNIIRGDLSNLRDNGSAIDLGAVHCIEAASLDFSTAGSEDTTLPSPGEAFFYLAEYNDGWTSSYGQESVSRPRVAGSGACR